MATPSVWTGYVRPGAENTPEAESEGLEAAGCGVQGEAGMEVGRWESGWLPPRSVI